MFFTTLLSSCNDDNDVMIETNTIVDVAINNNLTSLVAAVTRADLATTLSGSGPFTVFAPTNAAFAKLPAGTVETLLKPENKSKLAFILKNHVAPANFPVKTLEKNVTKNRKLYMASGKYLEVTKKGDDLYVGGSLYLNDSSITELPNNLYVGVNLYINNTPLTKKYTDKEIYEMFDITQDEIKLIDALIQESVEYAFKNSYEQLPEFVKCHSQEMSEQVMRQHIDLYVNDFSIRMGEPGKYAIAKLEEVYNKLVKI